MDTTIERVIFLQGIELFEDIPSEQLAHMAGITKNLYLDSGEIIFEEGEQSQTMYLLVSGKIQLNRNGMLRKEVAEPMALGVWGFFDGGPRLMTAKCKEECHLLTIDQIDFFDLIEERVNLSPGLLKFFAKRIRHLVEVSDTLV